jgi:hypothetical protein
MVADSCCGILAHKHSNAFLTQDQVLGKNLFSSVVLIRRVDHEIVSLEFLEVLLWLLTNVTDLLHFFFKLRGPLFLLFLSFLPINWQLLDYLSRWFRHNDLHFLLILGLTWKTNSFRKDLLVAFPEDRLLSSLYVFLVLFTPSLNAV